MFNSSNNLRILIDFRIFVRVHDEPEVFSANLASYLQAETFGMFLYLGRGCGEIIIGLFVALNLMSSTLNKYF